MRYTKEYKADALALAESLGNLAEAARQLGIEGRLIYAWKRQAQLKGEKSLESKDFPNSKEEIRHLRKEINKLKKTNEILKAAAAFFSQDHLK